MIKGMLNNDIKVGFEGNLSYRLEEDYKDTIINIYNEKVYVTKTKKSDWIIIGFVNNVIINEFKKSGYLEIGFKNHEDEFYNINNKIGYKKYVSLKLSFDAGCIGKEDEFLIINNIKIKDKKIITGDLNNGMQMILYGYEFNFEDIKWYTPEEYYKILKYRSIEIM
jgi:hypothetical protein